jgi:glycosyltransferase involved in cell wall biosynthesis
LAKNLDSLCQDAAMRRELGEAAARRARGLFSLETFNARHLEIYRRLLGS